MHGQALRDVVVGGDLVDREVADGHLAASLLDLDGRGCSARKLTGLSVRATETDHYLGFADEGATAPGGEDESLGLEVGEGCANRRAGDVEVADEGRLGG
jgi:hypothetical protein